MQVHVQRAQLQRVHRPEARHTWWAHVPHGQGRDQGQGRGQGQEEGRQGDAHRLQLGRSQNIEHIEHIELAQLH